MDSEAQQRRSSGVPAAGSHGGDGQRIAIALGIDPADVLDLSMSLNPLAPDVSKIIAAHLDSLRLYPDASEATSLFAEALGADPSQVVLTNGGSEAIMLVAQEIRRASIVEPEFSQYRRYLEVVDPSYPRFRSNPNNPTGQLAGPEEEALVWDEAFYPLATGSWSRGDARHGSVVVGSFTKLMACPGLRVGYVVAPDDVMAARVASRQAEWSVGALALASLPDLLAVADLPRWAAELSGLRCDLIDLLERYGLKPEPSDANFVLVRQAGGLREILAKRGVVVRDCRNFGLDGCVRIAVPDAAGLEKLEGALERAGYEVDSSFRGAAG
ncbi:MAG: aminotransferase class I/II-fold pyridoxal phosphate-dependent enzyme [Acidimicrobiales bacterium]